MIFLCVIDTIKDGRKTYMLLKNRLVCFDNDFLRFSVPLLSKECNKICILDKIYVSSQDNGIYVYSKLGKLEELITLGEHICDMTAGDDALFAVSYHDNVIFKIKEDAIYKKINLSKTPDSVLFYKNHVYCLANDGFYSYFYLFDKNLNLQTSLTCFRGIKNLKIEDDKILFNSIGYSYEIYPNLKIKSIKKHRQKPV